MKQYSFKYTNEQELLDWISTFNRAFNRESILIQMFSGILDVNFIKQVIAILLDEIPKAVLIGTTTSGEILEDELLDNSIVISISIFEHTSLKSIDFSGDDYHAIGTHIQQNLIQEDTKCIIMFADPMKFEGDQLLDVLNDNISHDIIIAGGMSGDNNRFKQTYCIHNHKILKHGVVAVSLSNQNLKVFNAYNLSWKPIGKKMIITKSDKNIVYEIDNQPIKKIYEKYLGSDTVKDMPVSAIEFPLIKERNGVAVARSMVSLTEDGTGMVYAGALSEGKHVQFAIGNHNLLLNSAYKTYKRVCDNDVEALFSYSCVARKNFLGDTLKTEFEPLSSIAPLSGFFTYGEFFHTQKRSSLLNVTTTILGLSEGKSPVQCQKIVRQKFESKSSSITALTNLVNITLKENEEYASILRATNKTLELKDKALNLLPYGVMITDIDGSIEWVNEAYSELTGYSYEECIGKNARDLTSSKLQSKEFYQNLWSTILSNKIYLGELRNRHKDGSIYIEEMSITPIKNNKKKIEHFIAIKRNITKKVEEENKMYQYAFYDHLTGLANRELLVENFKILQSSSNRNKNYFGILFLDLDNFKPLNDQHGHTVGDLLLKEVACRINTNIRDMDTAARFGGDEFVVLLTELDKDKVLAKKKALQIAEKIRITLADVYNLQSFKNKQKTIQYNCSASIGVSIFMDDAISYEEMLIRADNAMYQAKENGRNSVVYLDQDNKGEINK